jgi:hypothetical protein
MNLTDIMDGLAGLMTGTSYPYPADTVEVPCTVVGYPTTITYDMTPGSSVVVLPVWQLVGGDDMTARDLLSDALADAGSVKEALDGAHDWGDVRVTDATVEVVALGTLTYPALRFQIEVLV